MSDPFEFLPEPVLHHILSLLPSLREAARAALISRSWWRSWLSFPVFDFDFRDFAPKKVRNSFDLMPEVHEVINDRFLGFVDRSLSRIREQGIRLPRLKISTSLLETDVSRALFNKWIDMALEDCAQELRIRIATYSFYRYPVPTRVLSSDSLETLTLDGESLMVTLDGASAVNLNSLKSLEFRNIWINDQMLQELLRGCPLLENLTLYKCKSLKQVMISGLSKLRMVAFTGGEGVDRIEIELPNLEKLEFYVHMCHAGEIVLDGCRQLKHLTFMSCEASQKQLEELLSNFLLLESLTIRWGISFERIRISHPLLEKIEFLSCDKLMNIEVDAPKLLSFRYCSSSRKLPIIRMKNPASVPNCEAEFNSYSPGVFRFGQLREFLTGSCAFTSLSFIRLFELQVGSKNDLLASVPCRIGHLNLEVDAPRSRYAAILNGLLSICHPTTMRVNRHDPSSRFLKYLCRKLANREDDTAKCLCSRRTKCWLHKLKAVEIERITGSDHRGPLDWTTLFDLLPTLNRKNAVYFRLHWIVLGYGVATPSSDVGSVRAFAGACSPPDTLTDAKLQGGGEDGPHLEIMVARVVLVPGVRLRHQGILPGPPGQYRVLEVNDQFLGSVDRAVSRLREQGIPLLRLKICTRLLETDDARALLDKWIGMALEDGVQELSIDVLYPNSNLPYSVPAGVFSSDSLEALTLDGVRFILPLRKGMRAKKGKRGMGAASTVNLNSLYSLELKHIRMDGRMDDRMLQELLCGRPLLEKLTLYKCNTLKQIKVSGLSKLRMLAVTGCPDQVEIDLPNLEKLEFSVTTSRADEIVINGCQQLKHLTFRNSEATQEQFEELLSKFPLLESLKVRGCSRFERIRISHPLLEKIEVSNCEELKEIQIDAPRLLSFRYSTWGARLPIVRMKNPASVPNCEAKFKLYFPGIDFTELRKSLSRSCPFTSLSFSGLFREVRVRSKDALLAPLPCDIGHLNLDVDAPQSSCAAIVDGLLSICRPTTMRVSPYDHNSTFLKFLCTKLANRKKDTECRCSLWTKCWLHKLKGVEIERITESDHGGPLDWTTLFNLLPTLDMDSDVCFRLHW